MSIYTVSMCLRARTGIRITTDPICRAVLEGLGAPLLSGSVPEAGIKAYIFVMLSLLYTLHWMYTLLYALLVHMHSSIHFLYPYICHANTTLIHSLLYIYTCIPYIGEDTEGIEYPKINDSDLNPDEAADSGYEDDTIERVLHHNYMNDIGITNWYNKVDFIVDGGPRGLEGPESLSTGIYMCVYVFYVYVCNIRIVWVFKVVVYIHL